MTHHGQHGNYPDERGGGECDTEEFSEHEREHIRQHSNFRALEAVRLMRARYAREVEPVLRVEVEM